ncbi:hypothetical protein FRC01_007838, partial [Tulasnella sp. 417]
STVCSDRVLLVVGLRSGGLRDRLGLRAHSASRPGPRSRSASRPRVEFVGSGEDERLEDLAVLSGRLGFRRGFGEDGLEARMGDGTRQGSGLRNHRWSRSSGSRSHRGPGGNGEQWRRDADGRVRVEMKVWLVRVWVREGDAVNVREEEIDLEGDRVGGELLGVDGEDDEREENEDALDLDERGDAVLVEVRTDVEDDERVLDMLELLDDVRVDVKDVVDDVDDVELIVDEFVDIEVDDDVEFQDDEEIGEDVDVELNDVVELDDELLDDDVQLDAYSVWIGTGDPVIVVGISVIQAYSEVNTKGIAVGQFQHLSGR